MSAQQELRLLRLPNVLQRVALGRSQVYALVGAGKFPRPVHLGERTVAWVEREVDAWIASRIAERESCAAAAAEGRAHERHA
jgi:prophage regulatory protein